MFIAVFSFRSLAQSNQVDLDMAKQLVDVFLTNNNQPCDGIKKNMHVLFASDISIPDAYLFNLTPQGFVIVSLTNKVSPVLAYSFENDFAETNSPEAGIILEVVKKIAINDLDQNSLHETKDTKETAEHGPYVHTMWGQVNCYNSTGQLINVTNIYTPNHYAAGCVAVSQIMVMHHYNWPPRGNGAHGYTDNSGSSRGYYAANYSESYYDWDMMLERYRDKESTLAQRQPVGDLAFDVAISLFMDFEPDGSTSNVNRIPISFANYFRFTSLYKDESSSSFWSLLDNNMENAKPAVLAISGPLGGHSAICDGLKIEDGYHYYHLNLGWWGASNGWYKIRSSFDAGTYNTIDGAAMNIIPEPYVLTPEVLSDSAVTKIHWMYPEKAGAEAFELQVSINDGSWQTLSDDITDTCYSLAPNIEKNYSYRVRAKTNGNWYSNSWSSIVHLKVNYTSVEEDVESNIQIYPNPFNTQLKLKSGNSNEAKLIEIYTITGKIIYSNKSFDSGENLIIDTKNWNNGIYLIRVTGNNQVFSLKAIKK